MSWKAIGQSVTGTSHTASGKGCEDAVRYDILKDGSGNDILVCCVSDGAGSAMHAAFASVFTATKALEYVRHFTDHNEELTEAHVYALAEDIYHGLAEEAAANEVPISEYSCTMTAVILAHDRSAFVQIGDGAIVRDDGSDGYNTVWWPQTGEYHNTTFFITDDSGLGNLHVMVTDTPVHEVAVITDGLQLVALNMENSAVHQPFFKDLFRYLRQADTTDKVAVLDRKLAEYLDSPRINERTDDDKTLFMATRLQA